MLKRILSIAALLGLAVAIYHLLRVRMPANSRPPRPTHDYDAALARLHRLQKAETERVQPRCRSQLLSHGRRTPRAIVFFHGYTNCPFQFAELGSQFFAAGYNVLIPRLPHHGLEPLSDDQSRLSVEELTELANEAIDIAAGLGETVSVCGLSLGGSMAGWVAQNRSDVGAVFCLSPAFAFSAVPAGWRRQSANLLTLLPNSFRWWDPAFPEYPPERAHQYPRNSSRALATLLRLGQVVFYQAQRAKPGAERIVIVENPADQTVAHDLTAQIVAAWQAEGATVETVELPADLALIHDYIDPSQPEQQVDAVYPILVDLMV